jgi:signal transduction histidine kinase
VKSHGEAAVAEQILVECDAEQITQVLLNLLLNAIQVLPTGGKVAVSIIDAQDHVVVSVADDGAGVTEAQKEQIFDPFFTQRPGGIGLGLAVSKQIVTAHFGSLTVEKSTLANTGADFRVQLPKRQLLNDA